MCIKLHTSMSILLALIDKGLGIVEDELRAHGAVGERLVPCPTPDH